MNLIDIIFLAIALAMDCFTVSIVSGIISQGVRHSVRYDIPRGHTPYEIWRMALLFGLFQAMMPLLGWMGISMFQSYMEAYDHWIAFCLLAFIGGKMVKESFDDEDEAHFNPRNLKTQLLFAIATSIDALAVGISFACTGYSELPQLTLPLIIIGLVSFVFSIIGFHLGLRFGKIITHRLKPELLGGVILIIIGVKILISHLLEQN